MMVVLRVAALLLLGVVSAFMLWIMFVNLAGRENSRWFGGRPGTLGVRDGKLAPPKSTPNSVVSEGIDPAHPAYVAPITYSGDSSVAMARLGGVLQRLGLCTLLAAPSSVACTSSSQRRATRRRSCSPSPRRSTPSPGACS